jgi:hypothetical protein
MAPISAQRRPGGLPGPDLAIFSCPQLALPHPEWVCQKTVAGEIHSLSELSGNFVFDVACEGCLRQRSSTRPSGG